MCGHLPELAQSLRTYQSWTLQSLLRLLKRGLASLAVPIALFYLASKLVDLLVGGTLWVSLVEPAVRLITDLMQTDAFINQMGADRVAEVVSSLKGASEASMGSPAVTRNLLLPASLMSAQAERVVAILLTFSVSAFLPLWRVQQSHLQALNSARVAAAKVRFALAWSWPGTRRLRPCTSRHSVQKVDCPSLTVLSYHHLTMAYRHAACQWQVLAPSMLCM